MGFHGVGYLFGYTRSGESAVTSVERLDYIENQVIMVTADMLPQNDQ